MLQKYALAASIAVFGFCLSEVHAGPLRAGAAVIDITPAPGYPMWGYASRKAKPAVGVHAKLHARALVIAVGEQKLALVSLDLGRAPTRDSTARIRRHLKTKRGIDALFLVASHTHHGPVLELDDWPSKKQPYVGTLETKIIDVVQQADKVLQTARWSIVAGSTALNRNRHSRRPGAPVDRDLIVFRVEDGRGKPIAHAINFAAHPTLLPASLREFAPDFPGILCERIERTAGGVCLFLQGAAGDLSPNPPGKGTPEAFGSALANEVIALTKKLPPAAAEMKSFQVRERDFSFKPRADVSNPLIFAAYSYAFFPALIRFYEREYRNGVRPHLTSLLLDGRVGIVGVSGEFFCDHAIRLKQRARLDHLLVLGYCNDYQQYFPTIEAVAEGGYGADATVAQAEVGAGEQMMNRALIDLLEMQGKIRPFDLFK